MYYKVLHYITGYVRLIIRGDNALRYINALHEKELSFWDMEVTDEGYLISCSVKDADKIIAVLEELGAEYGVEKRRGLPFFVYPYRKRAGLLVGMLVAMLIVYASTRVIWDIRIECNGDYDEAEVLVALREMGVYNGADISSLDIYKTELGFLIKNPKYSDIAVNIQGTVAAVKLRLRTESPRQEEKLGAFDVVAAEPGVIKSVSAVKGKPTVNIGDTVNKGDILISGVMQGAYGEYYIHHACGSVKATVYREFFVIIPLESTEKVYTGRTETKTSYVVLGKSFDLFASEFSEFENADAETASEKLSFFSVALPVERQTLSYKEYEIIPQIISVKEAEERANQAFEAYIEREIEGEVISTEAECVYNEELNAVTLNGTVELITEIGVETPMTVFPESEEGEE